MMIIKSSEIKDYNLKLKKPFEYFTAKLTHLPYALITIKSDNGLIGYGEAALSWDVTGETQKGASEIFKYIAPILSGKKINSLTDIEKIIDEINLNINFNSALKSGIEMALLDLLGKYKKKPVYKLFKDVKAKKVQAQIVLSYSDDNYSELLSEVKLLNSSILKIKSGSDFEKEILFIYKITRLNKKQKIVLDVNQGWIDAKTSLNNIEKLKKYNILWIEQPVKYDALNELTKLKKNSPIKIMADESCHNLVDLIALTNEESVDFINIKLAKTGGFLEALKMIEFCEKNNLKFMLGDMLYGDLGTSANLHLAQLADFISFDITDPNRFKDTKKSQIKYDQNLFEIPQGFGFGIDLR